MSKGFVINMKSTEAVELATKDIDFYSKAVQSRIRGVIRKGTMAIYDSAVRMAPMGDTGKLKQGIRFRSANDWKTGGSRLNGSPLPGCGDGDRAPYYLSQP